MRMTQAPLSAAERALAEHDPLVRAELEGKVRAVGDHDVILWKIRAGYLAILYGSLGLLLGTSAVAIVIYVVARTWPG
jgi:hypothetical protein